MSYGEYPHRSFFSVYERRFQELERKFENAHRIGKVAKDGVKYDEEKKRWYVKFQEGEDDDKFLTDWMPWETMASGWLKISSPPYEGQSIQLSSVSGVPEVGSCRPYHNDPDTPSPSDKKGEYHMRVELPGKDGKPGSDKNKILDFHFSPDGSTVTIGDTKQELKKDEVNYTTKTNTVTTEKDVTKASESHALETKKRTVKAQDTTIESVRYGLNGKVLINS